MSRAANKLIAAAGAGVEDTGDDDFANVVLLLDGDGTSGDDNNTFTDSSPNSYTVTEAGSVTQGSFSPYGDNWSVFFDESGDYLASSASSDFAVGTGDFTAEFLFYATSIPSASNILDIRDGSAGFVINFRNGVVGFYSEPTAGFLKESSTLNAGEWYHVAAVRNGTDFDLYINGTAVGSSVTNSSNFTANTVTIGARYTRDQQYFPGYISNVRLVKGTAVYTSGFTAPTSPLTAVTNTKLLTCSSNRFVDESAGAHALTKNGNIAITPFSPFKNDDARDITTDGGSAYFDGDKSTRLYAGTSNVIPATGDFTVEGWVYFTGVNTVNNRSVFFVKDSGTTVSGDRSFQILLNNDGTNYDDVSVVLFQSNSSFDVSTFTHTFEFNEWYHIAVTRTGQTIECFINGTSIGTDTNTKTSINQSSEENYIGSWRDFALGASVAKDDTHIGYFGDFRITHSRVYTTDFTPPTSPLGDDVTGTAGTLNYVEYENKSFSVNSQETNPQGVRFKSDGTKMYVVGNTGDDVMQYSLSTAWDVSTASFDSVTLSVSSEDTTPNGLAFSSDGTKLYITGNANNKVFQYDLSTAWDLSTASYASKSLSTEGNGPIEPFMRSNGTDFYYIDINDDAVYQYTLSTANDISTASYASKSVSVASQETTPTGLTFSSNGTKMFVCGQVGDDVNQYTLSTAWDVSTASFDSKVFSFKGETTNPAGIDLKPDDTKLYMISNAGDAVYQYSLTSSAVQLLLNFQDAGIYDRSGINNIDTIGNAQIDTAVKKYGTGSMEFDGTGDYLETVNNSNVNFGSDAFTIESWVYRDAAPSGGIEPIISGNTTTDSGNDTFSFHISTSRYFQFGNGTTYTTSDTIFPLDQWVHLAVSYDGTTLKMFQDGVEVASAARSYSFDFERFKISRTRSNSRESDQYLDDLRVTRGVARYTSAFTPPTAALPKF
tara:strand:+ start:1466 stop:4291 length:2826 start_codon:yes stop_codon:yes gene_type:complete